MSVEPFECLDWETKVSVKKLPNDGIRIAVDNHDKRGLSVNMDRWDAENLRDWLDGYLKATA